MSTRTAAIIFVTSLDGSTVYLARRSDITKTYPGSLECVGGSVEPGESVEDAAVRELYEETGLIASPEHLSFRGYVFTHSGSQLALFVYRSNVPPKNYTEPGKRGPWIAAAFSAASQYAGILTPATSLLWHLLTIDPRFTKAGSNEPLELKFKAC